MKLSELSRRDYIAIEIVGHLAATNRTADICTLQAYEIADAMIAFEGKPKRDHELEDMGERLATVERTLEIFRGASAVDEITNVEHIFRSGFAAGHAFGMHSELPCNPHSEGADRAWLVFAP